MSRYILITPARDEGTHIEKTILSVVQQTILPAQWVIVDDGSTDNTATIIDRYAEQYPWITSIHRSNRGFRQAGAGVVAAFYEGYAQVAIRHWEFIVKLDADLSFAPDYFEQCFARFTQDARLGIGGGAIYHDMGGAMKLEPTSAFHVRGATKIYRRECWDQLGGLVGAPGWDTVDEAKANMLGWNTMTFPDLRIAHQRFTGTAEGRWKDCVKNGRANYITGYHPLFMLLKCVRRMIRKPYVVGALGTFWGFLSGYLRHLPRIEDRALIGYVRSQQLRRLLLLPSIWK